MVFKVLKCCLVAQMGLKITQKGSKKTQFGWVAEGLTMPGIKQKRTCPSTFNEDSTGNMAVK